MHCINTSQPSDEWMPGLAPGILVFKLDQGWPVAESVS
jgi:hypothetical protein